MENQLAVLPQEVALIAEKVSVEKRNEVQAVLNHVFNGVAKMREQLESISVKDQNDEVSMKLAGTIRLAVKRERLNAEKNFDEKRAEVQHEMLGFKTLDSLYLKAKQIMQIQTKELEEIALFKEETKKRFEAEQKELKVQQRMLKVAKVAPEMSRTEFESMSDETFEMFFTGIEKTYNDKVQAEKKAEEERIEKEKAEIAERERIRKENERLKAEAEAKEKQLVKERARADLERKALEEKAKKEKAEAEAKLKAEREITEKLEAELKAKAEAEQKAKKEADIKAAAEKKAKELAEKKAKAAPDKAKLNNFAKLLDELALPELKSEEAQKVLSDVKTLLLKVSAFIIENVNKL